ncbi:MAG: hypothetical protein DMG49_12355, partial [Acidobacteria bacterium]
PANKFVGSGGEIWFGEHVGPPKVTEVKVVKLTFLIFVILGGPHGGRRAHTPPTVRKWKNLRGGFVLFVGGSSRGLVGGFGNESAVLDESSFANSFRPADTELDERNRDPLVAFLFRVPNYYGVISYMPYFPTRNRS